MATQQGMNFSGEMRERGFEIFEFDVTKKLDGKVIAGLQRLMTDEKVDILHTHLSDATVNGSIAGWLSKVPTVATVHGMNLRWSYSLANHLITVSERAKQHLVRQLIPARKITAVYNSLPASRQPSSMTSTEAKERLGVSRDTLVLGTVSRASYLKGIDTAIQAFALLKAEFPDAIFLMVGDGKNEAELKLLAKRLGVEDDFRFLGFRTDIPELLRAMDLFVFPSTMEAMGIALLEAMASGIPIVASNVGGIPEVVSSEVGLLVNARDPKPLAQACKKILSDAALARAMSNTGPRYIQERFSLESMVSGVEAVYEKMLQKR